MTFMKFDQLRHDRRGTSAGGMLKSCRASHHLEGNPGEPSGHPNMYASGIFSLVSPFRCQDAEVVVASNQGVGSHEQHTAESAIAAAGQRARCMIDLIALITPGVQAGTTGDDPCRGVVHNRPGFAGELAGQHDVDAGKCQQTDIGRLHQVANELLLDGSNLFLLGDPIVVEVGARVAGAEVRRSRGLGRSGPNPGYGPGCG